jgi:hypothetical protein
VPTLGQAELMPALPETAVYLPEASGTVITSWADGVRLVSRVYRDTLVSGEVFYVLYYLDTEYRRPIRMIYYEPAGYSLILWVAPGFEDQ